MAMFDPACPGEIIADILQNQCVSLRQFAAAMDIAPSTASRMIKGKVTLTPEMALKLAIVLGGDAESWLSLQNNYSLSQARKNTDVTRVHRLSFT